MGFEWNKIKPIRFLLIRSICAIKFMIKQWIQTWHRSASYTKVWYLFVQIQAILYLACLSALCSLSSLIISNVVLCFRWAPSMQLLTEGYWKAGLLVEWHFRFKLQPFMHYLDLLDLWFFKYIVKFIKTARWGSSSMSYYQATHLFVLYFLQECELEGGWFEVVSWWFSS